MKWNMKWRIVEKHDDVEEFVICHGRTSSSICIFLQVIRKLSLITLFYYSFNIFTALRNACCRCTKSPYCIKCVLLCEVYYTHVCYCVRASDHCCVLCDVQCNTRLAIHLIHVLRCTSSSSLNSFLPVPYSFRMTAVVTICQLDHLHSIIIMVHWL